MSRKNRSHPAPKPLAVSPAELNTADALIDAALGPQPPALGNMSEADLAAIRGAAAPAMTASEMLANGGVMPTEGSRFESVNPEETAKHSLEAWSARNNEERFLEIASRLLSLEQRFGEIEKAMEKWAGEMNKRAVLHAAVQSAPVAIAPATAEEQAAYNETNFALFQDGKPAHNGIQAWRDSGSPVLKAKPAENPLARGRAA